MKTKDDKRLSTVNFENNGREDDDENEEKVQGRWE